MKECMLDIVVNILTYAIKNRYEPFSPKDFKNVVYTDQFDNFDINEKIARGCKFLQKRGLLKLSQDSMKFYEKYKLPKNIQIPTKNTTTIYKELARKIILMYEDENAFTNDAIDSRYSNIIEAIKIAQENFLPSKDQEQIEMTLTKILLSLKAKHNRKCYYLLTIIQLLELKSSINIEIKTSKHNFSGTNIKFNHIQFNNETIILFFNTCSFEIEDIKDIIIMSSLDDKPLPWYIDKSIHLLEKYQTQNAQKLFEFFKNYK